MLPDNGRYVKPNFNYHTSLKEFGIILHWVRKYDAINYYVMLVIQFVMGLRASEVCAIHLSDFLRDFHYLEYRKAKTNEIVTDPVPKALAELIKYYILKAGYQLKCGFLFVRTTKDVLRPMTEDYYIQWFRRLIKRIGQGKQNEIKEYVERPRPEFLEYYFVPGFKACKCGIKLKDKHKQIVFRTGRCCHCNEPIIHIKTKRYRIGTHSLRRLHRTVLRKNIDDVYLVKEICGYKKFRTLERYINSQEIYEKKNDLINDIFSPLVQTLMTKDAHQITLMQYENLPSINLTNRETQQTLICAR